MNVKYDHVSIAFMREEEGLSWPEIAGRLGVGTNNVRQSHHKWKQRREQGVPEEPRLVQEWRKEAGGTFHYKYPEPPVDEENAKLVWEQLRLDFERWRPRGKAPPVTKLRDTDPVIAVPNLVDAHFGMKADFMETGQPSQDLDAISDDWKRAVDHLVGMAQLYPVDKYLVPLGHDLAHYDKLLDKTGTTAAGTAQDFDSRPWKIFTAIRQASTYLIDALRATGRPVDVYTIPGNHDTQTVLRLGEALLCFYKDDKHVSIDNTPRLRKYAGYGKCAFQMYHGELNNKKGLPHLIFATECPADIWVASDGGSREILTGHFHKRSTTKMIVDVNEERGISLRSLPGLCSTDAWHANSGYLHRRAATLLVYKKSGGLHALHEFQP